MTDSKRVTREGLAAALRPQTRALIISGGDKGYEAWLSRTADAIFDALPEPPASGDVAALAADPAPLDWPTLANIIREVDGNHDLGAGELAQRILEHPRFAATEPPALDVERLRKTTPHGNFDIGWNAALDAVARLTREAE